MKDSFCPKCGQAAELSARFCSACGSPIERNGKTAAASSKRSGLRDVLIIGGLIVAVGVAFLYFYESPVKPAPRTEVPAGHEGMSSAMLENLPTEYGPLVKAGNDFMDQQNFPLAAELYRRALAIDSTSPDVRTDFGACLHGMGLVHRAIEEFHRVISEHPEHGIANFNLGVVYFGNGENDSALYYLEKYVKGNPEGTPADMAREYLKQIGS
jgi:tetratricopeptide (TPR) repeat protein